MMVGMGQDTLASMFSRGGSLLYSEPPRSTSGIVTPAPAIEMATGPTISVPVAPAPVTPVLIATNADADVPVTYSVPTPVEQPTVIPTPNGTPLPQAPAPAIMPSTSNVQVVSQASSASLSDWFGQNQTLALAGGAVLLLLLLGGRR